MTTNDNNMISMLKIEGNIDKQADTITFNVRGKLHRASRSLIMYYQEGNSMLGRLITDTWANPTPAAAGVTGGGETNVHAPIFIDRNGERFGYVLDFMRCGRVVLPYNVSRDLLLLDFDFYGIQGATGDTVLYGHAPHGHIFGEEPHEERNLLEMRRGELKGVADGVFADITKIETRLAIVEFASLCFSTYARSKGRARDGIYTVRLSNMTQADRGLLLGVSSWDLVLCTSENKVFLRKCLELYGLTFNGEITKKDNTGLLITLNSILVTTGR
jgi:hypothetical protein